MALPHLHKDNNYEYKKFTTMDQEIAQRHSEVHPNYDEADKYGNPALTPTHTKKK